MLIWMPTSMDSKDDDRATCLFWAEQEGGFLLIKDELLVLLSIPSWLMVRAYGLAGWRTDWLTEWLSGRTNRTNERTDRRIGAQKTWRHGWRQDGRRTTTTKTTTTTLSLSRMLGAGSCCSRSTLALGRWDPWWEHFQGEENGAKGACPTQSIFGGLFVA